MYDTTTRRGIFRTYIGEAAFYSWALRNERNPSTRLWLATRVQKYRNLARAAARDL